MRRNSGARSTLNPLRQGLVSFAAILLCGNPAAALVDENDPRPTLRVQGSATLDKPADQLKLTFGVVTQEATAAAAASQNAAVMTRVQAALRKAGIAKKELATLNFRIDPIYNQRPRHEVNPNWHPTIEAYRVSNRVLVTSADLSRAGELIDTATQAGANSIDSIHFGLKDDRQYRDEVIRAATANAIADAHSLAGAASIRLIGILEIAVDPGRSSHPIQYAERAVFAQAVSTPITPGAVQIQATVSVVYEIGPQN